MRSRRRKKNNTTSFYAIEQEDKTATCADDSGPPTRGPNRAHATGYQPKGANQRRQADGLLASLLVSCCVVCCKAVRSEVEVGVLKSEHGGRSWGRPVARLGGPPREMMYGHART